MIGGNGFPQKMVLIKTKRKAQKKSERKGERDGENGLETIAFDSIV